MTDRDKEPAVDSAIALVVVKTGSHRHHDFFQRTVSCPLADSVDRTLDLSRTGLDGRQAIGHSHPQVVMTMDAYNCLVDIRYAIHKRTDNAAHVCRGGVTNGVRNVYCGCSSVDYSLDDPA